MYFGIIELLKNIIFFIGRVENISSFPEQLSKEDEKMYIARLLKGDNEAKHKLIIHNLRLVAHIAKKYNNTSIDNEDIVSIGTIGLIKAIESFNGAKGTKIGTYAAKCIENEILMALRTEQKHKNNVFLQDNLLTDGEGGNISFFDVVQSDYSNCADICDKMLNEKRSSKLSAIMDSVLTKREKEIISMRYGLNNTDKKTQIQVAKIMNISRSYVSRIEKKAIEKLAKEYKKILPD